MPLAIAGASSGAEAAQTAGVSPKRVLILYSFNNNTPTQQLIVSGINAVAKDKNLRSADFVHEYLDIAPPKYPAHRSKLGEMLVEKYAGQHFDLIVAYSTEALNFLLNEGKGLSPGSPCISMLAAPVKEIVQSERKVSHFSAQVDPGGTLELGLKLFPATRKVLVVAGTAAADKAFEGIARTDFAKWQGKLDFEYTNQRSVDELLTYVTQLPSNTLLMFTNLAADVTGKSFVPRDVLKALAKVSNAPVFSMVSTQIDTGVIGGSMVDMLQVGAMIGNSLVALQSGKPLPLELPSGALAPMFDWAQIERWGIDPGRLPAESIIFNRPLTIWGQYKAEVVTAMLLILILSIMTIALVIQNRRRKLAEMSVRETAAQLAAERDMLEMRVTERTAFLTEALDFNETMLLNSPIPMGIYDESGQCELVNEAFAQFVGATMAQLKAQNFHSIASWKTTSLLDDCLTALKLQTFQQREAHMVTSFGKDVWFEYRILPRHLKGQLHLLIQFFDLTERKRVEDALRGLAFHDTLTQLPNRRLLLDRLTQALHLGKRGKSYLAVLFIDLNKFKQVNDNHGHDVGDLMLIEVANRLQNIVRESDTVARLGGDEFVVLLTGLGTDSGRAAQYADATVAKVRSALSGDYLFKNIHLEASASVGLRLILGGDMDPNQVLKDADLAMYEIKKGLLG